MSGLEWNEGMSVGVEAIDDDHKGLLRLINQLSDAIVGDNTEGVTQDIFDKLEDYIRQHFAREETMLAQCDFSDLEEHKKQHRIFIEQIPVLKSHLLSAENIEVAKEVCLFLINWLLNHIVVDDMSYAKILYDNGLSTKKEKKKSPLERLIDRTGASVVLNKRLYLSVFIPVLGLALMSTLVLWDHYHHYSSLKRQLYFTEIVLQASNLNSRLQLERRLSVDQLESIDKGIFTDLAQIRSLTDQAVDSMQQVSQQVATKLDLNGVNAVSDTDQWLTRLKNHRRTIDNKQVKPSEVSQFYSDYIENLMSMFDVSSQLEPDSEVSKFISAVSSIMHFIELNEQALISGAQMLRQAGLSVGEFMQFTDLVARQRVYLKDYRSVTAGLNVGGLELPLSYDNYRNVRQMTIAVQKAFFEDEFPGGNTGHWHGSTIAGLDQFHGIVEQLLRHTGAVIEKRVDDFKGTFFIITIGLLILSLSAYFVSWLLGHSIITPLRRLTFAMKRMSQGYRDIRFVDDVADDDIGEMYRAYEHNRRKLLQIDILSAVRFERQSVNIDKSEREKERYLKLASIDVLTGAINRRKFFELFEQEVKRYRRYKHGLALMMLDIDHFKKLNDTYGHAGGDLVLKEFYQCCFNGVRDTDIVARIGGEEFAILMPETSIEQAGDLAERLCQLVANLHVHLDDEIVRVTVSIGVSEWREDVENIADLMSRTDRALYEAKNNGRNRVVVS